MTSDPWQWGVILALVVMVIRQGATIRMLLEQVQDLHDVKEAYRD